MNLELQLWIWHRLIRELSPLSLSQVTSNLPDLGLHLGNSLSVHYGSILHIIDGLPCKLNEGLKSVLQRGLRRRGRGLSRGLV